MKTLGSILIGVAIALAATLLISGIFPCSLSRARELARRAMCMTQLNGLGKAMLLYTEDPEQHSNRKYPLGLTELVDAGYISKKSLTCPSVTIVNEEIQPGDCDYVLLLRGIDLYGIDSDTIAAYDLPINHKQGQVNFLRTSGGVNKEKLDANKNSSLTFLGPLQSTNKQLADIRNHRK